VLWQAYETSSARNSPLGVRTASRGTRGSHGPFSLPAARSAGTSASRFSRRLKAKFAASSVHPIVTGPIDCNAVEAAAIILCSSSRVYATAFAMPSGGRIRRPLK